jgi:hypothetical protein
MTAKKKAAPSSSHLFDYHFFVFAVAFRPGKKNNERHHPRKKLPVERTLSLSVSECEQHNQKKLSSPLDFRFYRLSIESCLKVPFRIAKQLHPENMSQSVHPKDEREYHQALCGERQARAMFPTLQVDAEAESWLPDDLLPHDEKTLSKFFGKQFHFDDR